MYQPGTILELREPQSTEDQPFAYDRVKVLGVSPVSHAATVPGQWQGVEAQHVLIQPVDVFDANIEKPLGFLQEQYVITEVPDSNLAAQRGGVTVEQRGPSPEEVFKTNAVEADAVRARNRTTTALQNDGKSPEQVLIEASLKEQAKPKGRTRKDKEENA